VELIPQSLRLDPAELSVIARKWRLLWMRVCAIIFPDKTQTKMESLARIKVLADEIKEIVQENKRYLASNNARDDWQRVQYEQRRERLESIKSELETLLRRN
jgi:hypothetical protein